MNVHPYSHPRQPEGSLDVRLEKTRSLMAKYGDADKPLVFPSDTAADVPTPCQLAGCHPSKLAKN